MIRCIGCLALSLVAACGGGAKDQGSGAGSVGLAAGASHTCARLSDSVVKCWGRNASGQLGNGTFTTGSSTPVVVSGISTATALAAGGDHACGVLADGTAQCWGANTSGQLGNGSLISAATPTVVSGLATATALAAGNLHTCALLANGTVKCWGSNNKGQVGNNAPLTTATLPVEVTGVRPLGTTATALAAGGEHTCAVLSERGTVNCWGKNDLGQLGNGTSTPTATSTPQEVPGIGAGLIAATALAAGAGHTCALLANATVSCWGSNSKGQLGATTATLCGATACSTTPLQVSGSNVVALAAGGEHTCVRLLDNTLTCWGSNSNGQIGDGTNIQRNTPVPVTGISTATAFAAGGSHTCARLSDGVVKCWGKNDAGQLGRDTSGTNALTPVEVVATF